MEETIWIERLSPCHGIIRSVLYQDIGINYGDVVLIDGAPITYHQYGDEEVPVFPHLSTLRRHKYQVYNFAGTQDEAGQLSSIDEEFEDDTIIYALSENYQELCATCWRDPNADHDHHKDETQHVVTGKIAAPAGTQPSQLLEMLDSLLTTNESCTIYSPEFCDAAGLADRAKVENRRFQMLVEN